MRRQCNILLSGVAAGHPGSYDNQSFTLTMRAIWNMFKMPVQPFRYKWELEQFIGRFYLSNLKMLVLQNLPVNSKWPQSLEVSWDFFNGFKQSKNSSLLGNQFIRLSTTFDRLFATIFKSNLFSMRTADSFPSHKLIYEWGCKMNKSDEDGTTLFGAGDIFDSFLTIF